MERFINTIAAVTALYHLIMVSRLLTYFGIFIPLQQHRAVSLSLALIMLFILGSSRPAPEKDVSERWYDMLFLLMGLVGTGFIIFFYDQAMDYENYAFLDTKGIVLALLLGIPLLEATRRATNFALPLIILFFLFLTTFQNYLPGLLHGPGFSLDRLSYTIYIGPSGIFGVPFGIASSILITFIIFGRLLQEAGGGKWFLDLALILTGRFTGGPAKAAVMSSFFFGMISGSPSANTATTGAITIPLMQRVGYKPAFAGAVEAVASTGGQIMPPVMGAIAFLMADWLGVSYATVAFAALVPAILYFFILFMSVHFETKRIGLCPGGTSGMPSLGRVLKAGWFYVLPLVTLIYLLLVVQYPPDMSGLAAVMVLIPCSMLSRTKEYRLYPGKIWNALAGAIKSWLTVACVTATVGMLIGSLELSGLGVKFSGFMVDVSGGNLLLTLVLVGIASLILGMGLDSIPCYIMLAILTAPALIKLGLSDISAHLFVIYWGLASFFTPPVCIAVYIACGISGGNVWKTGWQALGLGIAAYLVPIAFALHPALLLRGTLPDVIFSVCFALVGGLFLAAGIRGYCLLPLNRTQRIMTIIGGTLLIMLGWLKVIVGVTLLATTVIWQWAQIRLEQTAKNPGLATHGS